MTKTNYSIAITGEWPGAGQTTTAKALSQKLGLVRVYAGFLFRKFAYVWDIQRQHQNWEQFERSIVDQTFDISSIPFEESSFNQKTLTQWQNQLKRVDNMDMWDKIIEQQSQKALSKPGVLVEAKLAVVLDQIDLGLPRKFNHRIIKILLTCPPKITAKRIIQRKIDNQELSPDSLNTKTYTKLVAETKKELMQINLNDWKRYEQIYKISRDEIYGPDIHQIDTSGKNEQEVVNAIIKLLP
jgi:cytidylate kinase